MSVEAMAWALRTTAGGSGPKCLLLAVANHADKAGVAFPGRELLAAECECRPETVTANLARLETAGVLRRWERRRGNGSRTSDWMVLAPGWRDRGDMVDADGEHYPEPVAEAARHGALSSPEDSSPDDFSGEVFAPGQVRFSGGPEPSVEPSVLLSVGEKVSDAPDGLAGSPPPAVAEWPPEVERLCQLHSKLARARTGTPTSSSRLRPTAAWRMAMDRLLRLDDRSPEQVEYVIRWVDAHPFWGPNCLSAVKLRERFGRFVAEITAASRPPRRARPTVADQIAALSAAADAAERAEAAASPVLDGFEVVG